MVDAMTDKSTVFDFKAMFQAFADKNEKVWDHDRSTTLGASEAFGCIRKAWFDKRGEDAGYEIDDGHTQSWGAMERGNIMEEHFVVPVLETFNPEGTKFHFGSEEDQVTYVYGEVSATPDGLYTGCSRDALSLYGIADLESDCFMVEIKSIDPRSNLKEEKEIHHGQVQQQLGIIRRMTEHKPVYAVIIYVNASFYDDISIFVVKYDPDYWRAARHRAKTLNEAGDAKDLQAEGILMSACDFCKWTSACASVNKAAVPTKEVKEAFSEIQLNELAELARKEREADAAEKAAKALRDDVRADIKEYLARAGSKKAKDDRFSVSWTWQNGRETIDQKAMEADGIDIAKYKKRGNGFEKMTISYSEPDSAQ
jgi:cytochrome c553